MQWKPTKEGYLQFLVESRALFQTLEDIVMECSHSECAAPSRNLPSFLYLSRATFMSRLLVTNMICLSSTSCTVALVAAPLSRLLAFHVLHLFSIAAFQCTSR